MGTCKKRDHKTGETCGAENATYGVTIPGHHKLPEYSIMVCKRHFDAYLFNPAAFMAQHECGALTWLLQEMENVEPIR